MLTDELAFADTILRVAGARSCPVQRRNRPMLSSRVCVHWGYRRSHRGILVSNCISAGFTPPLADGLGCMIGCLALCAVAPLWAVLFCPKAQPRLVVRGPESTEKAVEQ